MGNTISEEMKKKLNDIKASDIMSRFAITIAENATIADLAHLLMRFKISGVPVMTRNNALVGIITATDLFRIMKETVHHLEKGSDPLNHHQILVKDIMIKEVFSVKESASLFEIMKMMCDKNIHTLPVLGSEGIVGIIGRRDAINAYYANAGQR